MQGRTTASISTHRRKPYALASACCASCSETFVWLNSSVSYPRYAAGDGRCVPLHQDHLLHSTADAEAPRNEPVFLKKQRGQLRKRLWLGIIRPSMRLLRR
jgi:hypothetical protein